MAKLLRIGESDTQTMPMLVPQKRTLDVPLADYEADHLLKVAKQKNR